jgi:hypothetical protein
VIYGKSSGLGTIDLSQLSFDQGFRIMGASAGDQSGLSVSSAGDVNHDTIADIIIGAYYASPQGRSRAGMTYIIYGQAGPPHPDIDLSLKKDNSITGFVIIGTDQDDNLIGTIYSETITGLGGNDIIEGKAGADVIDGGTGTNTASYISSPSNVTVNMATNGNFGGDSQSDFLISIQNLIGSAYPDSLTGDSSNNIIEGKEGADFLDGNGGTDTVSYASSTHAVSIDLLFGQGSRGDAEGDNINNFQNILGSSGNDVLIGDYNDNIIYAGYGSDYLEGGGGRDTLYGEGGADIFMIRDIPGTVIIRDFEVASKDKVDVTSFQTIHSINDLQISNSLGNAVITLPTVVVALNGVATSALQDSNFIFAPTPPSSSGLSSTQIIALTCSLLGGIGAIIGVSWTLWQCKKNGAFCFKDTAMSAASVALLSKAVDQADALSSEPHSSFTSSIIDTEAELMGDSA